MDCHVFRRFCAELTPYLIGARVEKIHQPAADLVQLAVYNQHQKRYLFIRFGRKNPYLMLSPHKLTVGGEPPAAIMRLRKHVSDRRLVDARADWVNRILWLRVRDGNELAELASGADTGRQTWLECNLREGVRLHLGVPPQAVLSGGVPFGVSDDVFGVEPTDTPEEKTGNWPDEATLTLCAQQGGAISPEIWRRWPVLTPALRRTLAALTVNGQASSIDEAESVAERAALLGDLQWGGGDLFVYEDAAGNREIVAWPLPASLRGQRQERIFEQALEAVAHMGEHEVLAHVAAARHGELAKPHGAEAARLARLLRKLESEEERLAAMAAVQSDALALQAELYRFSPDAKAQSIDLEQADPPRQLSLNPGLTVRENMAALFHRAARGKRGLAMLEPRRKAVREAMEAASRTAESLRTGAVSVPAPGPAPAATRQAEARDIARGAGASGRTKGNGAPTKGQLPKNVQAFRSSEGFVLLRGRDAKGNALLLKLGAPHDLWLHTGLGAGAHVLIRRDHAGREVPERTLREAAALAVNKSVFREAARAEVMLAEVRYVRPMKGAKTGMVRIDRQLPTLSVAPDPELEERLDAARASE